MGRGGERGVRFLQFAFNLQFLLCRGKLDVHLRLLVLLLYFCMEAGIFSDAVHVYLFIRIWAHDIHSIPQHTVPYHSIT